jgi:hypothetical protein
MYYVELDFRYTASADRYPVHPVSGPSTVICYSIENSKVFLIYIENLYFRSVKIAKICFHKILITYFNVCARLKTILTISIWDLVGSGPFCRIRIRPPKDAYYQSEKVIFSHKHFQYGTGTYLFSKH